MGTQVLFYCAILIRTTTYPLTGLEHRQLSLCSSSTSQAWRTEEMGLMNSTQILTYALAHTEFTFRLLTHMSSDMHIDPLSSSLHYVNSLGHSKLMSLEHESNTISLQTGASSIQYITSRLVQLKELYFTSGPIAQATGPCTQTSSSLQHSKIMTPLHVTDSITFSTGAQSVEYTAYINYTMKILASVLYDSTNVPLLTNTSLLNYGGDNTFYSLNGFYNYFRYNHVALLNTAYHVLIGKKLINMYSASMVCLESHKAGYKRIVVDENFLKDLNGDWKNYRTLSHLYYEDKLVMYDNISQRLYTYDFDNITFTNKKYFNLSSTSLPNQVTMCLDPTYKMPYIMTKSTESSQRKTEAGEYWNFLQIDNIKLVSDAQTVEAADSTYIPELLTPTVFILDSVVFRFQDKFIILGSKGYVEKELYTVDINVPGIVTSIMSYYGSSIIYADYPYVYYSEYENVFNTQTNYTNFIKLNVETLEIVRTELTHSSYQIFRYNDALWHMYKKSSNSNYYLYREDLPDKVTNLTRYLNLGSTDVIEFNIFNGHYIYLLTSSRLVIEFNLNAMVYKTLTLIGVPIMFVRFNNEYGCVLTRLGTNMYFEELMPIEWSQTPVDWITPMDMRDGELLLPYELHKGAYYERTAPITTVKDCIFTEYLSNQLIALELGVVDSMVKPESINNIFPIRVGINTQTVVSNPQHAAINPFEDDIALSQYSASLKTTVDLRSDGTFTIAVEDLPFPEQLETGFRLYEK